MRRSWEYIKGKLTGKPSVSKNIRIYTREEHGLSRKSISKNALKVLYRLHQSNFDAYLVGGGVRDLLAGLMPKDFDIVTNARPEQIRKLFNNSRIIGRRFRLVHVFYHGEIIEVSTFRAGEPETRQYESEIAPGEPRPEEEAETMLAPALVENQEVLPGMIVADNTYGTLEQDAFRRDFTVNALYYNIKDFSMIDHVGGMEDLKQGCLRIIGNPRQRFHEDPVRMLRAIRLAAKLNFTLDETIEKELTELTPLLQHVPSSRLFDEVLKLFFAGNAQVTFVRLHQYGYFRLFFPAVTALIENPKATVARDLLEKALHETDLRIGQGHSVNPGFLFAIFLWPVIQQRLQIQQQDKKPFSQAMHEVIHAVIAEQQQHLAIRQRYLEMMRSIWMLQFHLEKRRPARVLRIIGHRYFRAAVDFLMLRAKAGELHMDLAQWWETFRYAQGKQRDEMIDALAKPVSKSAK